MSTINLATQATVDNSRAGKPYTVNATVNVLAAQTAKGSNLATGDVINVLTVPIGYAVDFCSLNVSTGVTGASVFTISLGDGTTATKWTSAVDGTVTGFATDATAGAVSLDNATSGGFVKATLGTVTGVPTGGVFNVTAKLVSVVPASNAGTPTF